MQLYRKTNGICRKVNPVAVEKEKTLPAIMGSNIYYMLDLHSLEPGYSDIGDRVDTLAVDKAGAPVIILYKLSKYENVINRALPHLKWLRAQKAEFFEMLVRKKLGKELTKTFSINLNDSRVICIAGSYSKFEVETVDVMRLKIQLLLYREYEDDLFTLEPLRIAGSSPSVAASAGVTAKDDEPLEALLARSTTEAVCLFSEIRQRILQLDDSIQEKATRIYVAYRIKKNFAEVALQTSQIRIKLRAIEYFDPERMVHQVPGGYNWTEKYVHVTSPREIDYVLRLIEQSYRDVL